MQSFFPLWEVFQNGSLKSNPFSMLTCDFQQIYIYHSNVFFIRFLRLYLLVRLGVDDIFHPFRPPNPCS